MKNIFDLKNLDDLAPEIKTQLFKEGKSHQSIILSLFDIKNELTKDEIIVGLSRMYSVSRSRAQISNSLYMLKKKCLLENYKGSKKFYTKIKT